MPLWYVIIMKRAVNSLSVINQLIICYKVTDEDINIMLIIYISSHSNLRLIVDF